MDIDYRPPVNSRRINNRHINNRPIRIWDRPNAQAGHHLTDPSPPVTNASTNSKYHIYSVKIPFLLIRI
jgi:hypothetical protein